MQYIVSIPAKFEAAGRAPIRYSSTVAPMTGQRQVGPMISTLCR